MLQQLFSFYTTTHKGFLKDSTCYRTLGQKLYAKYPCIKRGGSKPWGDLTRTLSGRIRTFRYTSGYLSLIISNLMLSSKNMHSIMLFQVQTEKGWSVVLIQQQRCGGCRWPQTPDRHVPGWACAHKAANPRNEERSGGCMVCQHHGRKEGMEQESALQQPFTPPATGHYIYLHPCNRL